MTTSEVIICIPVYDDWTAVARVLEALDRAAARTTDTLSVLLVDDGSSEEPPNALDFVPSRLARVEVLRLRRNLGHQRAIAIGLSFIEAERSCVAVVVMDGDGEDEPQDVPKLLEALERSRGDQAVFAARARRSEGVLFAAGYLGFKALHRLLTGRSVEIGNFSAVPRRLLARLVGVSELWNHYAAAVVKARLPAIQIPLPRARRLAGTSRMSFVGLVAHGLSAISVYGEIVAVRLLCVTAVAIGMTVLGIFGVLATRLFTELAIPGWATAAAGLLGVLLLNLLSLVGLAVIFLLQARERASFLPLRDYANFILEERRLHG